MEHGKISICKRLDCSFSRMDRHKRLRVSEVNPHLICVLCGGYYIDATTIIECLHTFCKTCIVGYLEASKHCPVCDNLVHKTKPHLRLRPDHTLQDIVYKLVPGLFQDEMRKRREFYNEEIETGRVGEHGIPEERERIVYFADEQISLVLELSPHGKFGNAPVPTTVGRSSKQPRIEPADRRYLMCPGGFNIGHLKKFIKMKFNLPGRFEIDFYHTDETLSDHYTLVDIAYIYSWRRKGPLRLFYSVFTNPAKRFKADTEDEPMIIETDTANNSDLKTETSGYFSDDEKHNSELSTSHDTSRETDESKTDSVLEDDGIDIDNEVDEKGTDDTVKECKFKEGKVKRSSLNKDLQKEDRLKWTCVNIVKPKDSKKENAYSNSMTMENDNNDAIDKKNTQCNTNKDETKKTTKIGADLLGLFSEMVDDSESNVSSPTALHDEVDSQNTDDDSCASKPEKDYKGKADDKLDKGLTCAKTINEIEAEYNKRKDCDKDRSTEVAKKPVVDKGKPNEKKPNMVEASTEATSDTVPCTSDDILPRKAPVLKQSKSCLTDEDVSEPVVSSTQNTQGCQTESPESGDDTLDIPHSFESENTRSLSPCHTSKTTVDVSCETDNFVVDRQTAKARERLISPKTRESASVSVSVSTDTYDSNHDSKRKYVDCSTDVYDFQSSDTDMESDLKLRKVKVDCSTDLPNFALDTKKQKTISIDSSVDSSKRKTDFPSLGSKCKPLSIDLSGDRNKFKGLSVDYPADSSKQRTLSVDCSTMGIDKRRTLSVDCSMGIDDIQMASNKRKSYDSSDHSDGDTKDKKAAKKAVKRMFSSPEHLSTPKAGYQSQPLSPTKITLKFTQPKSPGIACSKSPSRSEESGFQSQYQSFVKEFPEKTYTFDGDDTGPPLPPKPAKLVATTSVKPSVATPDLPHSQKLPSTQKKALTPKLSKTGRPRGRPPKNRSPDTLQPPVKEKKHKSRSHSPKRRKSHDRDKEKQSDKRSKSSKAFSTDTVKRLTAYSWINKLDQSAKSHKPKPDTKATEKPPSDLRIPKQFVYFSNGQYTLATESSLNALKQSSPVSPPPRTVFASELGVSSKIKPPHRPKPAKSEAKPEYKIPKISKSVKPEAKPKDVKQTDKPSEPKKPSYSDASDTSKPSLSSLKDSNVFVSAPQNTLTQIQQPQTLSLPASQSSPSIDSNQNKIVKPAIPLSSAPPHTSIVKSSNVQHLSVQPSSVKPPSVKPSTISSTPYSPAPSASMSPKEKPAISPRQREKTSQPVTKPPQTVTTTSAPLPEYRHQSPFFNSIKLSTTPHRSTAHLTVPNINSHFSGTHHLYSQGRYGNERLGNPIFGPFPMSAEATQAASVAASVAASKLEESRRIEAMAAPYLAGFHGNYLGLMHSHLVSSLPLHHPHLPHAGHYQDSPKSLIFSDHATNGASSMSQQNAARNMTNKPSNNATAAKGKSIDKVVNQLTEMRTKKETQEQINGIDLSTKGCRKDDQEGKAFGDTIRASNNGAVNLQKSGRVEPGSSNGSNGVDK